MPRPIHALIHTDALAHNLQRARAAAPGARVFAVVKANAYGHGLERALEGLRAADGLALLDVAEAERVRACGWRGPVLLLEGAFEPRDLEWCSRLQLWHVVHCADQIDWLAAHKASEPHHVFLKLNSGMNRLGFSPSLFRAAWTRLSQLPQVNEISLMSHFANADTEGGMATAWPTVEAAMRDLPGAHCLANSAAVLREGSKPEVAGDWVRAGIMLYGSAPDHPAHRAHEWGLLPAMSLRSRLIAVQPLQAGDTVGYGSRFEAPAAMRLGVVACGYADGYPRHAPTGTPVLIDGQRTRIIGRVSMDMITVDLTPVPEAGLGSEVTLWGMSSTGERLDIDEVAQAAGTVGYELMCALATRVAMHAA